MHNQEIHMAKKKAAPKKDDKKKGFVPFTKKGK